MGNVFAAGWIKNGPIGVILTTMMDAQATADAILADLPQLPVRLGSEDVAEVLRAKGIDVCWRTEGDGEVISTV